MAENGEKESTQGWVTVREAAQILRCSKTKVFRYEEEGRLERKKLNGRNHYRLQDVKELLEALEMEGPPDGEGRDISEFEDAAEGEEGGAPSMKQTNLSIVQAGSELAQILRASVHAAATYNSGTRAILGYYKTALFHANQRVRQLEEDRAGMFEKLEKLADKSMEREIERRFAEKLLEAAGDDGEGAGVLEKKLDPLFEAIIDRVRGTKARTDDMVARRVRSFFDMLSREQIDGFMSQLKDEQRVVLVELIKLVREPPKAEKAAA